jgi:hypothetical protein
MTTPLNKTIKREITHAGKAYTVTVSPESVKVTPQGARNGPELTWGEIIDGRPAPSSPVAPPTS